MSLAPRSEPRNRCWATPPARSNRAAERRTETEWLRRAGRRRGNARLRRRGRDDCAQEDADGLDPLFLSAEARALGPVIETVFLGLEGEAGRFGLALRRPRPKLSEPARSLHQRSAIDRRAGPRRAGRSCRARRSKGAAALARAPPLLRQLRRAERVVQAGWLRDCPALQGAAFSAHRPGGDHAGDRRRPLSARPPAAVRCPACIRASPASSSRARRIEEAVRRETIEEAGIAVGRVALLRLAALAVPDVADDRLPRRGADRARSRSTTPSWRTRAGSPAKRRADAGAAASGRLPTPPPMAIAHHIIRAWVEREDAVRQRLAFGYVQPAAGP